MKPMFTTLFPALGLLSAALGVTTASGQQAAAPLQPADGGVPAQFQWGDFDADGLDDAVAITPNGALSLLHNAGDGSFVDVTQSMGIDVQGARFAVWEDYDQDGLVDLFVGTASGPGRLLHNAGAFFVDVTERSGLDSPGFDEAAQWIDYDGDGLLDLHLVQASANTLYHGLAAGGFEPVALPRLASVAPTNTIVTSAAAGRDDVAAAPAGDVADRSGKSARSGGSSAASAGGRTPLGGPQGGGPGTQNMGAIVPGFPQCTRFIQDDATGQCMAASSTATLGMLYPLSSDFFIEAATGNVGIGTTTPGNPRLRVGAPAVGNVAIASGGALAIAHDLQANGGPALFLGPSGSPTVGQACTSMTFRADGIEHSGFTYTPNFGGNSRIDMNFGASFEQSLNPARFSFLSNGRMGVGTTAPTSNLSVTGSADFSSNVGIGTSSPSSRLDVAGSGAVGVPVARIKSTSNFAHLLIENGNPGVPKETFLEISEPADVAGSWTIGTNDQNTGLYIGFGAKGQIDGHDDLTLDRNGHLGIGTINPAQELDINGKVQMDSNLFGGNNGSITTTTGAGDATGYLGPIAGGSYMTGVIDINGFVGGGTIYDPVANTTTISGNVKNFRQTNPADPNTDIVYACVEGPEAAAYVRGTAQLVNGQASIALPAHFASIAVAAGMTVHVTPHSSLSQGLAVVDRSTSQIEVRELMSGQGSYEFDWEVKAVRQGFEDYEVVRPKLRRPTPVQGNLSLKK